MLNILKKILTFIPYWNLKWLCWKVLYQMQAVINLSFDLYIQQIL